MYQTHKKIIGSENWIDNGKKSVLTEVKKIGLNNWINSNQELVATVTVVVLIMSLWIVRKQLTKKIFKMIFLSASILYGGVVLQKTVFGRTIREPAVILDFLWSYRACLNHELGMISQIYLNIMLFIPFGLFSGSAFITDKKRSYIIPLLLGVFLTLSIEFLQFYLQRGTFELDDILNNMIGTVIGVIIVSAIRKCVPNK